MLYLFLILNTVLLAFDSDTISSKNLIIQTQQIGIYSSLILDDSTIYTFGGDGSMTIIKNNTLKKINNYHRGAILSTLYKPYDNKIVSSGWDGKINTYFLHNNRIKIIYNNNSTIFKIISLNNGNLIISNNDKEIFLLHRVNDTIYKVESYAQLQDYTTDELVFNQYSNEIYNLINSLFGCEMQIYNKNLELKKIIHFDNNFYSASVLNDTTMLLGDEYGNINIFSTVDYQIINSINISNNRIIKILQKDNILIISSWDNTITFYDIEKSEIIKKLFLKKSWINDINYIGNSLYIFTLDSSIYRTFIM